MDAVGRAAPAGVGRPGARATAATRSGRCAISAGCCSSGCPPSASSCGPENAPAIRVYEGDRDAPDDLVPLAHLLGSDPGTGSDPAVLPPAYSAAVPRLTEPGSASASEGHASLLRQRPCAPPSSSLPTRPVLRRGCCSAWTTTRSSGRAHGVAALDLPQRSASAPCASRSTGRPGESFPVRRRAHRAPARSHAGRSDPRRARRHRARDGSAAARRRVARRRTAASSRTSCAAIRGSATSRSGRSRTRRRSGSRTRALQPPTRRCSRRAGTRCTRRSPRANVIATSAPHAKPGRWYEDLGKRVPRERPHAARLRHLGHNAYPETSRRGARRAARQALAARSTRATSTACSPRCSKGVRRHRPAAARLRRRHASGTWRTASRRSPGDARRLHAARRPTSTRSPRPAGRAARGRRRSSRTASPRSAPSSTRAARRRLARRVAVGPRAPGLEPEARVHRVRAGASRPRAAGTMHCGV